MESKLEQKKGKHLITKKSIECKNNIKILSKDFCGNMSDKELIKLLHISSNTYYKYKRELKGLFNSEKITIQ